jgi:3',5'-cyclic AMP phosphodiesterase CpdA
MWSRAIRAAYSFAPDARFIIHAGDLVEQGYDDNLWGEWCDAMGFISSMTPNFPVPGNHDLHRAPDDPDPKNVLSVSPVWRRMFSLPTNGPEGVEELNQQSYYIDYQGVRFVAIDVNVYSNDAFLESQKKRLWEKQTAWLEQILKNNPNRWTIVIQHQPIYPVSKGRDYEEMRAVLAPLYDRYHVDLVLQGHDHAYARSNKIFNGRIVPDSQDGTIYVISVSGPKMYEPSGKFDALMAKQIRHTQLFQVVQVNGSELTFQAYTSESQLVDSFNLKKK